MKQLYLSLLMIFFINGHVQAAKDGKMENAEYFPLSFSNLKTIINWSSKLLDPVNELIANRSLTKENIKKLQKEVKSLVSELDNLEDKMEMQAMNRYILYKKRDLFNWMKIVDKYYDDTVKYGFCQRNTTKVDAFFEKLTSGPKNLPTILPEMYEFIQNRSPKNILGLKQLLAESACIDDFPPRQILYFVYSQLLLVEMKGLAALLQTYARRVSVDGNGDDHIAAMHNAKIPFEHRLNEYKRIFTKEIAESPQNIHRCRKLHPERGIDFQEVQYFSRIKFLYLLNTNSIKCGTCESIELPVVKGSTIYNCITAGYMLRVCPAESGSFREYMWVEDQKKSIFYGRNTTCDQQKHAIVPAIRAGDECPACACSVDLNKQEQDHTSAIWRISTTEQISDLWNDMVVTGVKLVTYDNAIHIQIQQAKFLDDALSSTAVEWKELGTGHDCTGKTKIEMKYEPMHYDRKSLYLDDIILPSGYVVTGARFNLVNDSAFMLEIQGTPFDLETARLDRSKKGTWFNAMNPLINPGYNATTRIEIKMDGSDDPTKIDNFGSYDARTTKVIKFSHTDLHKDAGQTTIPLLDIQPVEGKLPFPLSGVGLFYSGKGGYGGYVAPRTYILDVIPYLNMEKMHEEALVE